MVVTVQKKPLLLSSPYIFQGIGEQSVLLHGRQLPEDIPLIQCKYNQRQYLKGLVLTTTRGKIGNSDSGRFLRLFDTWVHIWGLLCV